MVGRYHCHAQCGYLILWGLGFRADSQDADYIRKHYTVDFDENQAVHSLGGRDESSRIQKGQGEFKPYVSLSSHKSRTVGQSLMGRMYLIAEEKDPRKLVRPPATYTRET